MQQHKPLILWPNRNKSDSKQWFESSTSTFMDTTEEPDTNTLLKYKQKGFFKPQAISQRRKKRSKNSPSSFFQKKAIKISKFATANGEIIPQESKIQKIITQNFFRGDEQPITIRNDSDIKISLKNTPKQLNYGIISHSHRKEKSINFGKKSSNHKNNRSSNSASRIQFIRWIKEPIKTPEYKIYQNSQKQDDDNNNNNTSPLKAGVDMEKANNLSAKKIHPRIVFSKNDVIKYGCMSPEKRFSLSKDRHSRTLKRVFLRDGRDSMGSEISKNANKYLVNGLNRKGQKGGRNKVTLNSLRLEDIDLTLVTSSDKKYMKKQLFMRPREMLEPRKNKQRSFYKNKKYGNFKARENSHRSISIKMISKKKNKKKTGGLRGSFMIYS